ARQFPADIAGLALIDASTPEQLTETPGFRESLDADIRSRPTDYRWERLGVWTGWERLSGRCTNEPANDVVETLSPEEARRLTAIYVAETCRLASIGGEYGELVDLQRSYAQAARLTSVGNVPLLVLSSDPERADDEMTAAAAAEMQIFSREHEQLKLLSTRSWRVIARNAGHAVH